MKKKILVVIDMQNDFTTGVLGNNECKNAISKVKEILLNSSYDNIIFTQDTHQANYLSTQEGAKLPVEHCIENTTGWEIVPELLEAADTIAQKNNTSIEYIKKPSFGSIELGKLLNKYYIDNKEAIQVDFVGVCTGICVISNVMITKAQCPEAEVNVIADACACVTPDSHNVALEAMKTCQVNII